MHSRGRRRQRDYVYRPMTGVQTDFSTLLKQFIDTGSVRYEKFAELWRASKMPLIFSGRQTDAEAREVCAARTTGSISVFIRVDFYQGAM